MPGSSDKEIEEIKQDKIEKLIEQKVEEKTREKNKKIEKLQKEVEKIKSSSNTINNHSQKKHSKGVSRREFLKKIGLGTLGVGALSLSPVSAFDIKDDNFSVTTSPDNGSTLTKGLFVDQNQNVKIPNGTLNIQGNQAATRNWAQNQGWITASEAPVQSVEGQTGDVTVDTTTPPIYGTGSDGDIYYNNNTTIGGVINADNFTIESGTTVSTNSPTTVIFSRNYIEINGTISSSGQGGGTATYLGGGVGGSGGNVDGGGTGNGGPSAGGGGGGGDYGEGSNGDNAPSNEKSNPTISGIYGSLVGELIDQRGIVFGVGGGSGGHGGFSGDGGEDGGDGGSGGSGGGAIVLIAPEIRGSGTVDASGTNGQDGKNGSTARGGAGGGGGGGGGAGGCIILASGNLNDDNLNTDISGGVGGNGGNGGGYSADDGGSGGNGNPGILKKFEGV